MDETILLDILEQSDNNVQKASEKLIELGYEKRNPTCPNRNNYKQKEQEKVRKKKKDFEKLPIVNLFIKNNFFF